MRSLLIFCCCVSLTACSTTSQHDVAMNPLKGQVSSFDLLLSSEAEALLSVEAFLEKNSSPSEMQKIDYLLMRIKNSPTKFFRNNQEYDGDVAAKWLRWKMGHKQYASNPIRTASRFVHEVADGSKQSGLPYQIIFLNGDYVKTEIVFQEELDLLENEIRKKALVSAMDASSLEGFKALANDNYIAPVILTAAGN